MAVLHLCQCPYAVLKLRQLCKPHPRANHAPPSSLPLPPRLLCKGLGGQGVSAGTLSGQPPSVASWLLPTNTGQGATASQAATQDPPNVGPAITTADTLTPREAKTFENPSLPPIPPQLMKNIESGKYIDMGDLLPEALSEAFDRSQRDTKDDNTTTSRHKFPISTPLDWALAYSTYSAVVTHFHPAKSGQMITYSNIVLRLAREVKGRVWFRYDRAFRQAAAIHPNIRWDRREPDIWLAAMSEDIRPPSESAGATQTTPATEPTPACRKRATDDELCYRFNRGECTSRSCRFGHKCLVCQSAAHPAKNCPILQPARRRYSSPAQTREGEKKDNTA